MKIKIQARGIKYSKAFESQVEKVLWPLSQRIVGESQIKVTLTESKVWQQVSLDLKTSWGSFRATGAGKSYEEALAQADSKLESQVIRHKDKLQHHKSWERSKEGRLEGISPNMEFRRQRSPRKAS